MLMIEDNAHNAYLARVLLEQRGHEVTVATTGTEGVALARDRPYDLILLDLRLPDGDGCDFVPALAASGGFRSTPVVAVSAHAHTADRARALQTGCSAFVEKPIDVATFAARIEAAGASTPPRPHPSQS
jgi:CheY-like chemotaxis protein